MVEQLTLNQRVTGSSPVRVKKSVTGGGEVSELADEHDLGSCAAEAEEFESPLPQ